MSRCDGGPLDSSYAELLGWYLGDGYIHVEGRRNVYNLHVSTTARTSGIIDDVSSI